MSYNILGAGLAGLSAAINLAKAGKQVTVYERLPTVGKQIHPNYQAIRTNITGADVLQYLKKFNLNPSKFSLIYLNKMFISTPSESLRKLHFNVAVPFIMRGGEKSLEYALYKEAQNLDIAFEFNSKKTVNDANIIASGKFRTDAAAFGEIYEAPEFPRDSFFYMHHDRYSPKGWYSYIIPVNETKIEIVNCVSQPHVKKVVDLYRLLLTEHPFVKKYTQGKKPLSCFGGYGAVDYPKTAFRDGKYYVGEAAGFQDACRGFGMHYALESGFYAAKAILENKDYDQLWQQGFGRQLRTDFARRFATSVFGDKVVEWYFKKIKNGEKVDYSKLEPKGSAYHFAENIAFNCELLKKNILGRW